MVETTNIHCVDKILTYLTYFNSESPIISSAPPHMLFSYGTYSQIWLVNTVKYCLKYSSNF